MQLQNGATIFEAWRPLRVFYQYDAVPVLYLDTQSTLVVFAGSVHAVESKDDLRTWLAGRLSMGDVLDLLAGKIDLYSAFRGALSLTAISTRNFDVVRFCEVRNVGDKWLPAKGEKA